MEANSSEHKRPKYMKKRHRLSYQRVSFCVYYSSLNKIEWFGWGGGDFPELTWVQKYKVSGLMDEDFFSTSKRNPLFFAAKMTIEKKCII